MAQRYGAATSVLDWREWLVCSKCGGRDVDMVVTGARRYGRLGSNENVREDGEEAEEQQE